MESGLWKLGATELARLIRERQVSSREAVEAHLARIQQVNPAVNAITVVLAEEALQAADAADRLTASGAHPGPLHGVPFTVKENIDLAGSATTNGIVVLKDAVSAVDAPHIAQVRAAVRDFLGGASAYHVILYAASAEAVPHRYTGPGDEAFPGAVRRAVRRIGRLLPALAAVAGLEALASTLGEDSPLVQRMRAKW